MFRIYWSIVAIYRRITVAQLKIYAHGMIQYNYSATTLTRYPGLLTINHMHYNRMEQLDAYELEVYICDKIC